MSVEVKKIGGSVLKSQQDFKAIADYLAQSYKKNNALIVVVSAPYGETNSLMLQAQEYSAIQGEAYELLLQTGEQKSCALLGLSLQELNVPFTIFCGPTVHLQKKDAECLSLASGSYWAELSVILMTD